MKNRQFHFVLRKLTIACRNCTGPECQCKGTGQLRVTVGRIADELVMNRCALNDVINNKPGRGGQTRKRVAVWLGRNVPDKAADLLNALGWDADGKMKSST